MDYDTVIELSEVTLDYMKRKICQQLSMMDILSILQRSD